MSAALTDCLSALVLESSPPSSLLDNARDGLMDYLGCAIAGLNNPVYLKTRDAMLPFAGAGEAFLIGETGHVDEASAALLNGTVSHVLDFDDIHPDVRGHPSIVVLSALFSCLKPGFGFSALDFLRAYIMGVEVMARIGRAMKHRHYERGFHATATFGPLGAAAALGYLLKVNPETLSIAFGIAATQAGGLRGQFSTEVKPIHAGFAARAGVVAMRLAQAGVRGNSDILGDRFGLFEAMGFGEAQPELCVHDWGKTWAIAAPGLTFKLFPCCGASYLPVTAFLELCQDVPVKASEVERVVVTFPPGGDAALTVTNPKNGREGQFSIEYILSAFLIDGTVSLSTFSDNPLRKDIKIFMPKVIRRTDLCTPSLQEAPEKRFATVEIFLENGVHLLRTARSIPKVNREKLKKKFLANIKNFSSKPGDVVYHMGIISSRKDLMVLCNFLQTGMLTQV